MRPRRGSAFHMPGVALALVVVVMLVVGGCRLPENALDGPLAVPLRIAATSRSIEVDAPGWYSDETALYLCPTEPRPLPEPGPDRDGWTPGGACHDFGRVTAVNGLQAVMPLDSLTDAELITFGAAMDWYVLLVALDDERATAAITTSFTSPIQPAN